MGEIQLVRHWRRHKFRDVKFPPLGDQLSAAPLPRPTAPPIFLGVEDRDQGRQTREAEQAAANGLLLFTHRLTIVMGGENTHGCCAGLTIAWLASEKFTRMPLCARPRSGASAESGG